MKKFSLKLDLDVITIPDDDEIGTADALRLAGDRIKVSPHGGLTCFLHLWCLSQRFRKTNENKFKLEPLLQFLFPALYMLLA